MSWRRFSLNNRRTKTVDIKGAVTHTYQDTLTETITGAVTQTYSDALTLEITGCYRDIF